MSFRVYCTYIKCLEEKLTQNTWQVILLIYDHQVHFSIYKTISFNRSMDMGWPIFPDNLTCLIFQDTLKIWVATLQIWNTIQYQCYFSRAIFPKIKGTPPAPMCVWGTRSQPVDNKNTKVNAMGRTLHYYTSIRASRRQFRQQRRWHRDTISFRWYHMKLFDDFLCGESSTLS